MEIKKILAKNIRRLRLEKGMSQLELATQADITPGMAVDLEYGRANPKMKTLNKIAGVLDVPFYALFDEENSQYPYLEELLYRQLELLLKKRP